MKNSAIVAQLQNVLPRHTNLLSRSISLKSLVRSGTTLTGTTDGAAHLLTAGEPILITGAEVPMIISAFTRPSTVGGTTGTIVTTGNHDLTEGSRPTPNASTGVQTVTVSGAVDGDADATIWNGAWTLTSVDNRTTLQIDGLAPFVSGETTTPDTTQGFVEDAASAFTPIDGSYEVLSTPSRVTFTVAHATTTLADPLGTILAQASTRITAAATFERALAAYTSQDDPQDVWMYSVLGDTVGSKDRLTENDAIADAQIQNSFRQHAIMSFDLFAMFPARDEIAGADAADLAQDLWRPLVRSLVLGRVDSGLTNATQHFIQFESHGVAEYSGAVYAHRYSFQQMADLRFEDTVGPDLDVALRDVDLTIFPQTVAGGTQEDQSLTLVIDVDEV